MARSETSAKTARRPRTRTTPHAAKGSPSKSTKASVRAAPKKRAASRRPAAKRPPERATPPATIMRSDRHAQSLWRKAHASAVKTYGEGARSHRVAYSALKHEYEKRGDRWVRKPESGPSDAQAARGPTTRPRSTDKPTATAGGRRTRKTPSGAALHAKSS